MKRLAKANLRQSHKYLFYEKESCTWEIEQVMAQDTRRTVREDSGSSFHDVGNDILKAVMVNLIVNKANSVRAGKGMIKRRFFVNQVGQDSITQNSEEGSKANLFRRQAIKRLCLSLVSILVFYGLGVVASAQQAGSQNAGPTDTRLERYTTVVEILDESLFEFSQRPERSRERLALAQETFELIREGSGSSSGLIDGLANTFERADTAITNQSLADFEIQTGLILGGLQRFLYERATREALDGNVPLAQSYIKRVIEDLNILEDDKTRLTQAVDAGALQAALEIGAGKSISSHLTSASDALTANDQQGAYVSLANAYSGFVTVQDSLSMPPSVAQALLTTIQDVVSQNPEAAQNVAALQKDMASYIQFNESVLQEFNDALSGEAVSGEAANGQAGAATASQPNSIQNAVARELAQQGGNASAEATQAVTALANQATNATRDATNATANVAANANEAIRAGMSEETPLVTGGLKPAIENANAAVQQAPNAIGIANPDNKEPTSTVTLGAPSLANNRAQNANNNALTVGGQQTGAALTPAAPARSSVRTPANNSAVSTPARSSARTPVQAPIAETSALARTWNGFPKAIVMLLLALASFIPLYLLQLAFGSGSKHWLWVRLAVFLLFLPIMFEGIASLASLLADVTGVSALGMLEPFTVSGGALGQIIWAGTSLIAIASLCFGLWGICKQFGLLGQGSSEEEAVATEDFNMNTEGDFATHPGAMTERFTLEEGPVGTVADMGNETVIEWEDEF